VAMAPAAPAEKALAPANAEPAPVNVSSIAKDIPAKDSPAKDSATRDSAAKDAGNKAAASPATPLVESKSIMAPPDPAASKLVEPGKLPSVVAAEPIPEVMAAARAGGDAEADATDVSVVKIQRIEFGVDVGGANSVPGLRALWRGLLKSRSNAPLAELRPIIVIKEGSGGLGMRLRLVAGPLRDAAGAAKICAVMSENKRPCETAIFDGQRLTMDANEPAPAAKPAPQRRRSAAKRATVEEPKKPEQATTTTTAASTISSFFGRKSTQ
jgi:hypothetical protein